MSIYSLALRSTGLTIANASASIVTAASKRVKLLQCSMIQATGTAQTLGLGRPATAGTPTTPILFQADEPADPASVTSGYLTWSAQPTAPTIFHRRWNSAATIGVGIIWTFPRGLGIAVSSSLVVWNVTTAVATDINFVIDE